MNFLVYHNKIIPGKIKNIVYHLEISALVPEIFKFEKCVKYANDKIEFVGGHFLHSVNTSLDYGMTPGFKAFILITALMLKHFF